MPGAARFGEPTAENTGSRTVAPSERSAVPDTPFDDDWDRPWIPPELADPEFTAERRKVTNLLVSQIQNLAQQRGRDPVFATNAITQSENLGTQAAFDRRYRLECRGAADVCVHRDLQYVGWPEQSA